MIKINSKGFTLVEVMIASAMLGTLALFSVSVLSDMMKINTTIKTETDSQTDVSLATLYLTKVLRTSKPSFNNLVSQPDDNGKDFFDYYSDVPTDQWDDSSEKSRTFTLSEASGKFEFYTFVEDPKQKEAIAYDPRTAYEDVDPPAQMDTSAVLKYRGLNGADYLKKRYPDLWATNQIFIIRVPVPLRYVAADGLVSMEAGSVPREVSYIGQVAGDTLTTAGFDANTLSHFWNRQPIDGSKIDDPDMLLRKIPSIGGGAPLVIMEAIRIMKISLEKNQKNSYDLFLSEFTNGNFSRKIFVSTDVKELVISRESVSRSILRYKLTLNGAPQ